MPENHEAALIYQLCRGQLRTIGPNNIPFAPDLTPVIQVMELYQVRDKKTCLEKVLAAFSHFIAKAAANAG